MRKLISKFSITTIIAGAGLLLATMALPVASQEARNAPAEPQGDVASVSIGAHFIDVAVHVGFERGILRIAGPQGYALTRELSPEDVGYLTADLLFDAEANIQQGRPSAESEDLQLQELPDGLYRYEVILFSADDARQTERGKFTVDGGAALETASTGNSILLQRLAGTMLDFLVPSAAAQTATNAQDDFFISNPAEDDCTSLKLLNDPSFLDLVFNNDGGAFTFQPGLTRCPEGTPLMIIDGDGTVGIGTGAPQSTLHVDGSAGESPLRIQSQGATALAVHENRSASLGINVPGSDQGELRLWGPDDFGVGGELRFQDDLGETFIRNDSDGGLIIRAGEEGITGESRIALMASDIGIGTLSPASKLSVEGSDADFRVDSSAATESGRTLMRLRNNGFINFVMENVGNETWLFSAQEGRFTINSNQLSGSINAQFFTSGNLTLAGTLTENSSRTVKHDIAPLDASEVLEKISNLEVSQWRYDSNPDVRHVGPMAEDWHALFGLGDNDKGVAPRDLAGIALSAAQALYNRSQQLEAENMELRKRLDRLEASLLSQ